MYVLHWMQEGVLSRVETLARLRAGGPFGSRASMLPSTVGGGSGCGEVCVSEGEGKLGLARQVGCDW